MQLTSFLRPVILGGLFLVPFIPLVVYNGFFFPFITGKGFAFRIIVGIIAILWATLALLDRKYRPQKSALLYAVLLFVGSIAVSTALSENPSKSFWSNFERMEGWISLAHLSLYFIVLTSMLQSQKLWRTFWNISIGVSVFLCLYGVFQILGVLDIHQGGLRIDATFGNATYFAVYLIFHVFLTLHAYAHWGSERLIRYGYALAALLQFVMIFFTATRGAILGVLGGLLLSGIIIALFGKNGPKMRAWAVGGIAALLIMIGGFILIKDTSFVQNNEILQRLASISLEEGSTRFAIWNMALEGALERPFFGWGPESFNYLFNQHYQPSLYGQEPWFDRAHNQFFDWLVAGGFLGFIIYVSLFGVSLWYVWRKGSTFEISERALFTGLLAAYAFHNLFVFDHLMSSVLFFSMIGYIASKALTRAEVPHTPPTSLGQGAAVIVFALGCVLLYMANVPGMARASTIIEGLKPHPEGVKKNFELLQKATLGNGLGTQEAHEQLVYFAVQLHNESLSGLSTAELRNEIDVFADNAYAKFVETTPNDTRIRLFYGTFLHQIGQLGRAYDETFKAHELSPTKQMIMFELGSIASDAGNTAVAEEWFKRAFELERSYKDARAYYAAILIRSGKLPDADQILIEGFQTATPDHDAIIQAYLATKNYPRVIAIAESRIADDPNSLEKRMQLAATYLDAGNRAGAIQALEDAIRINPEFKSQGEYFIQEIRSGRTP